MNPTEISSINELLNYIYSLSSLNSTYRYRGQANFDWSLQPSIYRYENLKRYQTMFFEEILLSHKPTQPIPNILNTSLNIEWLMLCQHYNIPTRFLDWTSDILISLYFACNDSFESDGSLFICNQNDYETIPAIDYDPMEIQNLVFINTNIINPRMRAQSGCFMVWGHSPLNKEISTESYDLWEYHDTNLDKNHIIQKIKIPKFKKKQLLNDLDTIYGINHNSIYLKPHFERNISNKFSIIKKTSLKYTLYITEAERLSIFEREIIKKRIPHIGENAFGGCVNMKMIKGLIRL
jgi:hypothetical protein